MLEAFAPIPPWLMLSAALGIAMAGGLRLLLPKHMPGLLASCALLTLSLAAGHLIALAGDLPTWQIGNLRVAYGLGLACLLLWLAKSRAVW